MTKLLSCLLSFTLLFTSVAPSAAQAFQTPKVGFRVSASNSLEEAVTRQMARNQQQAETEYWIERGEVLASKNSTYHYWEQVISKLIEARNQARGNIQEAVVCSENGEECIPALAYAWGGIHHGIKDSQLYYKGQIIDSTATDFAWLVSNFGIYGESDRKEAVRYFYDLIKMAGEDCSNGAFEYGSQEHRADQRIASEKQAKRCATEVSVIPALAMITKGASEQQKAAQTFYNLLKDKYDTAVGGAVIQACVTGLGVLGTQKSYQLLETFLTDDTIPSTAGNVLHGIGSPFETLAQNGLRAASNIRGGNSRFLNRINEQFQYLDKEEAKRQGFTNTAWQSEGIQYPYANVLEEVGAFLGQQSATNTYARALAKKLVGKANQAAKEKTNAAGVMHYPLVLGIMDGWREHGKTFIYEPAPELINFFYKGDWFDLNEGTQRRVHYKAYQFARSRGWTPELPKRDPEKIQRTIYNSRLLTIGFAGDSVLTVLMTGYLIKSIPALAKGIPQAVKTLSSRKAWVGATNYFKTAPKKVWANVKGGPRAKEIPLNPATRPVANARPATAAKPAKKPAQAKKRPAAKQQTSQQASQAQPSSANANGYTTVDMGVRNGQRTVAIATSPEQEAALAQQRVLYASTGDGFANVAKTETAVADGAETTAQAAQAAQTAQAATQPATQAVPRWIEVETTNALGNTVKTWKPNPAHPEYNQILAELSGQSSGARELSWWEKAQLNWAINWKPAFQNMFTFGTSRYGLAAAAPGAAPVTSEAAIAQAADAPAVVQTIRAQQGMFITEESLRGGAGAAYRTGAVNRGGVAAQQFANATVNGARAGFLDTYGSFMGLTSAPRATLQGMGYANSSTLNALRPWLRASTLIPAGMLGASLMFGSTEGVETSLAMAPLLATNSSWRNWFQRETSSTQHTATSPTKKDIVAANKFAETVLSKPNPLAAQLRDIIESPAAVSYKKQALLRLYEQGIFSKFLDEQTESVKNKVSQAATDAERTEALYRLYQAGYLDSVLQAIPNIQVQGSVLNELRDIVSREDWKTLARSAYEVEAVLPLETENFMGSVSPVPEPDLEKIEDLVRPAGYAAANSDSGVATKKGVFYKNNIPFYYRNAKGTISSSPVGILTQMPANRYGRILSSIYLANQPGFTVPEGFVLALDEQGQWKFVVPKGNLSTVEANKHSRKQLNNMRKGGSARAVLDTNYTTSDLLAMAHLLEYYPEHNLELTLNTPHSLSPFLFLHALFVGNDAGNTLTGPFKKTLSAYFEAIAGFLTNLLSGIGYATPLLGGKAMPTMKKWGNVKTTQIIYGAAAAALGFSLLFGMNGIGKNAPELSLWILAIPTVALVAGASLINSFVPYFLNFYKDPAQRTAANLQFDTRKQLSRMGLSFLTAVTIGAGGNWTVVVPIGLALLGFSYALFINTPMYKGEKLRKAQEAKEKQKEAERFASLSPEEQQKELAAQKEAKEAEKRLQAQFAQEYKDFKDHHPEMIASKHRVRKVYATYAASLMILGQSAAEALGEGTGQSFVTVCMFATFLTRWLATRLVKANKVTDDQLTGLSLPTMSLTAFALALLPYSSVAAGIAAAAAILHNMSTAVPGRLDAARMQNIVTAEMQQRKQQVLDDTTLTPAEKKAKVDLLTQEESTWASLASRGYSYYNATGLLGIGIAALVALGLTDLASDALKESVTHLFDWTGINNNALSVNRLLFLYAGGMAGWAYLTNKDLTREGLRLFQKKTKVSEQNIQENKITPKLLGINEKNAEIQLGNITSKRMKEVEPLLVEYGISSEQKMTKILTQLQFIHNRLVAISQILGPTATRAAFEREAAMVRRYATILGQNDLSVMLRREFDKLQIGLFGKGTQNLLENPVYVEEGLYELPSKYTSYEEARMLIKEIDQMAYNLRQGNPIDYEKFAEYLTRAREALIEYEKDNPADSIRVMVQRRTLDNLCKLLAQKDKTNGILDIKDTDSKQIRAGKQAMRDLLSGYQE